MTLRASCRTELHPSHAPQARNQSPPNRAFAGAGLSGISIQSSLQVGKYLVSSLTRPLDSGRHAAAVSIRSGRGSMTHDRVLRFTPDFDTPDQATCFAIEQALAWIDGSAHGVPLIVSQE